MKLLIALVIIAVSVAQVTECSHIEISKAENLELNQQKVEEECRSDLLPRIPDIRREILCKKFRRHKSSEFVEQASASSRNFFAENSAALM